MRSHEAADEQRKDVSLGGKDNSDFTCRLSRTLLRLASGPTPVDGAAIARRLLDSGLIDHSIAPA